MIISEDEKQIILFIDKYKGLSAKVIASWLEWSFIRTVRALGSVEIFGFTRTKWVLHGDRWINCYYNRTDLTDINEWRDVYKSEFRQKCDE